MSASLNAILSVAKTGLLTNQLAIQVTSNNVANASTEGYSRQRAEMVPGLPIQLPEGLLGTGVRVADITRARNALLDVTFRRESSLFHGADVTSSSLASIEAVLGEPGDLGLGASLDAFWNAWSDLSNDPSSLAAREVVVARGRRLTDHFQRVSGELDAVRARVTDQLSGGVEEVNRMLGEVAELNGRIVASTAGGRSAPELADRRDLLLDQLSTFVPIEVTGGEDGSVGVSSNGIRLVEGIVTTPLSATSAGGVWSITTSGGTPLSIRSGTIGGALEVVNGNFADYRLQLDELAQGIVERVNGSHATGTNPLGATGVNFFEDYGDPTTVTAQTLRLDAAVEADVRAVAAGSPDGGGAYQPGANDIALAISGLRTETTGGVLDGRSINGAYRDLVAQVGAETAAARERAEGHDVLRASARERRESVSGVATDEELVKIIQFQAGYSAAARVVTVVDEMYQTILSI